ncbi:MAG TPA: hypothetical protein VFC67_18400 [Prolixibacteraceae bacterium]|nr:hypothetical protein [Prolixibacteraceae bacterium]
MRSKAARAHNKVVQPEKFWIKNCNFAADYIDAFTKAIGLLPNYDILWGIIDKNTAFISESNNF